MSAEQHPGKQISSILKHDRKVNSYKFALVRALNDIALAYPDIKPGPDGVAIPIRFIAERWVAYYWPFMSEEGGIKQGPEAAGKQDMAFRKDLTNLRSQWDIGQVGSPSDGFVLVSQMRSAAGRVQLSHELKQQYRKTIRSISRAVHQPIRYAGGGDTPVFAEPQFAYEIRQRVVWLPATRDEDRCLVVHAELWEAFQELSLWIESLCIYEWCLFTESIKQPSGEHLERGTIFQMLTVRPVERRLLWERQPIIHLMQGGCNFICPWTGHLLQPDSFELDHIVPIAVYPVNELWNLMPADPRANNLKRDYIPSLRLLLLAEERFRNSYICYTHHDELGTLLNEDALQRFAQLESQMLLETLPRAVIRFAEAIATGRNVGRIERF